MPALFLFWLAFSFHFLIFAIKIRLILISSKKNLLISIFFSNFAAKFDGKIQRDMAQNKGAIVRYRAIDRCLRAKHGRYGIEELQRACADALYDAFSERFSVSRRQIYLDLNHMESNAGYRADIEHYRDGKKV
ncbi:MAG: hypothetical protein IKP06_07865 [Elusimicrobiaceae bacterium]|nr:hypothetical protein [Elusimicrobiaceae bacterium]